MPSPTSIMATEVNSFSNLESLLLVQSVVAYGNTAEAFTRISKSLRSSSLLQRQPNANVDRLNPDALTKLYLRLLKSEAKRALIESSSAASALASSSTSASQPAAHSEPSDATSSKTNGIPSPQLSTIEDATPHRHLEPLMIDKLYALYKDQITQEIKEDENRYDQLVQEVNSLESLPAVTSTGTDQAAQHASRQDAAEASSADARPLGAGTSSIQAKDDVSRTPKKPDSTEALRQTQIDPTKTKSASTSTQDTSTKQSSLNEKATPKPSILQQVVSMHASKNASEKPTSSTPSSTDHQPLTSPFTNQTSVGTGPSQSSLSKRSGGMQLPPFQVSPQVPVQTSKASSTDSRNTAQDNKPPSPGTQTPSSIKSSTTKGPLPNLLQEGQGVHYSPGSSTGWKVTPGMPDAATPRPRSISPLSERDSSPERASKRRRTTRGVANVESSKPKSSAKATSQTPSMAATSSRGRTQSPSAGSPTEEAGQATSTAKRPKTETSTPAPTSATLNPPPTTRSSRATRNTPAVAPPPVASPPATVTSKLSTKRKRASTHETDGSAPQSPAPIDTKPPVNTDTEPESEPPNTIRASRNFHKASAPILNNIGSHKHASLFSQPVSSRTKGYYDIIKRPTDLNSIRKAIAAGVKAVNAAISSGMSSTGPQAGSPGGVAASTSASDFGGASAAAAAAGQPPTPGGDTAHTVVLPLSHELVPPEGIVNGAQLEQEIMRMFANAVMFNEGDDGVVADTREMFNEVGGHFSAWKEAQSSNE